MINFFFSLIWDWILSWGGLSLVVALGAGVAFWFLPPTAIRLRAVSLAVCIAATAINVVFTKGYADGVSITKDAWKDALVEERRNGEQILRDARDAAVRDTPDSVRKHPWNRDRGKQQAK